MKVETDVFPLNMDTIKHKAMQRKIKGDQCYHRLSSFNQMLIKHLKNPGSIHTYQMLLATVHLKWKDQYELTHEHIFLECSVHTNALVSLVCSTIPLLQSWGTVEWRCWSKTQTLDVVVQSTVRQSCTAIITSDKKQQRSSLTLLKRRLFPL